MLKRIDISQTSLKKITTALLNYADELSFVVREGIRLDEKAGTMLKEMKQYLVSKQRVSQWPGTTLFWGYATLYTYQFNGMTTAIICKFEDDLYSWLHPIMPEDLVFYRKKKTLFVSITHEREAYIELENEGGNILKGVLMT